MMRETFEIAVAHRPAPLRVALFGPYRGEVVQTVVFSHGDKLVAADYAPLFGAWTQAGLAIAAPDHGGAAHCPVWRARALDMHAVAQCVAAPRRGGPVRVAGHSFGAHTAALLLGARPTLVEGADRMALPWVDAGVLLTPPGDGSEASLAPEWAARAPYLVLDRAGMLADCLIIAGGRDPSPITRPGWRWTPGVLHARGRRHVGVAEAGDHYLGGMAAGRGGADPALLAGIAAVSAGFLCQGPGWTPPGSDFVRFA